jgi:hypothetical protein
VLLGQQRVVGADPRGRRHEQRRGLQVGPDTLTEQHALARLEEPLEVRIGPRPRRAQDQAAQAAGMIERDHLADRAPGGVAHEVRGVDAERVHQAEDVIRHLLDRVVDTRMRAAPGSTMIVDDDAKVA